MIFETIQNQLAAHSFEIVAHDHNRPWGGFFVIAEAQAQAFADAYFEGLDVSTLKIGGQYHHRRAEIWRVIQGQAGVVTSHTDEEGVLQVLNVGDTITLQQGERHRLIGLSDYAVIAEIWQHTDAQNPSDEADIVRVQDDFGR